MPPRKKQVEEVLLDEKSLTPEVTQDNKVLENIDKVNEALDKKLEDLDGIGPVRIKKLYANGIYTVDDLLSRGEEWLSIDIYLFS